MAVVTYPKVSLVLSDMQQALGKFVEQEKALTKGPTNSYIEAATDLRCAIENTELVCSAENVLDQVAAQAEMTVKGRLEFLQRRVQELFAKKPEMLPNIVSLIQLFNAQLPSKGHPLFTGMSHRYVFIQENGFEIVFSGRLKESSKLKDFGLILDKQLSKSEISTTPTNVHFVVSGLSEEFYPVGSEINSHFVNAALRIPYQVGEGEIKQASFPICLGVFPRTSGKITLSYPKMEPTKTIAQQIRSSTMKISRKDFAKEGPIKASRVAILPTKGWTIEGAPKAFSGGKSEALPQEFYTRDVVYLEPELAAGESEQSWYVEFTEVQAVWEEVTKKEEFFLSWGKTRVIPAKTFELKLECCMDGKTYELTGPGSLPYLTVTKEGEQYTIISRVPDQV